MLNKDGAALSKEPHFYNMQIQIAPSASASSSSAVDITNLCMAVKVYESIFQQALIAEIDLADGIGLLEEIQLTGNEVIVTKTSKKIKANSDELYEIDHTWYLLDIPVFSRTKPDLQAYKLRCVSPFGAITRILRSEHMYYGTPIEVLEGIYKESGIGVNQTGTPSGTSVIVSPGAKGSAGNVRWIPNNAKLGEAMQKILAKSTLPNGAPLFAFETFDGKHFIESYNDYVTKPIFENETFRHASFYTTEVGDEAGFEEKRRRILNISSELDFSALKRYSNGSIVSRVEVVDWGTKTAETVETNTLVDSVPSLEKDSITDPNASILGFNHTNLTDTGRFYINRNTLQTIGDGLQNIWDVSQYTVARRRAILDNINQITHTIRLHGDPRIRSGEIIAVELPKINAPEKIKNGEPYVDELLSGRYLVVSVTHMFDNEGYYIELKVKKDSINRGGIPISDQPNRTAENNTTTNNSVSGPSPSYPAGVDNAQIESWIATEAASRGIDIDAAIAVFRAEGAGSYQSQLTGGTAATHNGKEASFGPFQLYTGGGLGNEYEERTGRNLLTDNTADGVRNQIRFALDKAAEAGNWNAWYGARNALDDLEQGLSGASVNGNWS